MARGDSWCTEFIRVGNNYLPDILELNHNKLDDSRGVIPASRQVTGTFKVPVT
ncbi:MAG: hypothetical protein GTO14_22220 [Anaerolineales bacterium]|nr:hypothetical protein [Anaerolineales bacterium]